MSRHFKFLSAFLVVCTLVFGTVGASAQVKMEGSVLFVAPHRLIIPPNENVDVLNVSNNSDETRRYDLTLIDQVMGPDGVTMRQETFPYSIKRMVRFVPKRFSLKPGEHQTVRVMVERTPDMTDGDYHSHLLFREVPLSIKDKEQLQQDRATAEKTLSFEIRTLYGIAVPIVIQKGKIVAELSMDTLGMSKDKNGKWQIDVGFLRTGNAEAAGKLHAEYVPAGGKGIPAIDDQWVRIYREADKVSKSIELSGAAADAPAGGKIIVRLVRDEADDSKTQTKEIAVK